MTDDTTKPDGPPAELTTDHGDSISVDGEALLFAVGLASHRTPTAVAGPTTWVIPGYEYRHEIARGGMGAVLAARDPKFDREVAIKVLIPDPSDGSDPNSTRRRAVARRRFLVESRITAALPHPNIPPAYDLGTLPDGEPFLAMKYIRGRTFANHLVDRPEPSADQPRMLLVLEQVAQAVGFAHAQGIIHRDLKPLNVMVGAFGEVLVMDWGLAKDTRGPDTDPSDVLKPPTDDAPADLTAAGEIMGTVSYMPPEQADGRTRDVTARSDVFGLGAILCEILTGYPPFTGMTLKERLGKAVACDLSSVEARLAGCGADAELVALLRRCLSANPADRPADGQAVADALVAHRLGVEGRLRRAETDKAVAVSEVVSARKRRRVVAAAAGAIIAALTVGIGLSLWQADVARHERTTADVARKKAEDEERRATERERDEQTARKLADRQRAIAEKTREFLIENFAMRPAMAGGTLTGGMSNVTLRDVLDHAESQISKSFQDFPEAEFDIRAAFAVIYQSQTDFAKAEMHAARARQLANELGIENSLRMGIVDTAVAALRDARVGAQAAANPMFGLFASAPLGTQDKDLQPIVARQLAAGVALHKHDWSTAEREADALFVLVRDRFGETGLHTLIVRMLRGVIYICQDRFADARRELQTVVDRADKQGQATLIIMCQAYQALSRYWEKRGALAWDEVGPELERAGVGVDRLGLWQIGVGGQLAEALGRYRQHKNDYPAALVMYRRALAVGRAYTNENGRKAAAAAHAGIGVIFTRQGKFAEAAAYLDAAIENAPPPSPRSPPTARENRLSRARCRVELGQFAGADADLKEYADAIARGTDAAERLLLGQVAAGLGQTERAVAAAEFFASQVDPSGTACERIETLGRVALARKHFDLAATLHARNHDLRAKHLGPTHPATLESLRDRAASRAGQGKWDDAIADFRTAADALRRLDGTGAKTTRAAQHDLASAFEKAGRPADHAKQRRDNFDATRVALGLAHEWTREDAARLVPTADLVAELGGDDGAGLAFRHAVAVLLTPTKPAVAADILAAVVEKREKLHGADNADVARSRAAGGAANEAAGRHEAALALYLAASKHPEARRAAGRAGLMHVHLKQTAEAARRLAPAFESHLAADGLSHPDTLDTGTALALVHLDAGRVAEAHAVAVKVVPHLADRPAVVLRFVESAEKAFGADAVETVAVRVAHGDALRVAGKPAEAVAVLRKAVDLVSEKTPDDPLLPRYRAALGRALAADKKYPEAEPLLADAHKSLAAKASPHAAEAARWLAEAYRASGKPDKAVEWDEKSK